MGEFEVDTDLSPEQMPEMLDEMRAFLTTHEETGFCKEFAVDADDELVSESSVTSLLAKRMQSSGMDDADDDNKKSKGPPVLVIVGAAAVTRCWICVLATETLESVSLWQ